MKSVLVLFAVFGALYTHSAWAMDASIVYCKAAAVKEYFFNLNNDAEAMISGLLIQYYYVKVAMWNFGDEQNSKRDITQPPGSARR